MKPLRELSAVLGVMLVAGLAMAQVAPPPPAAPAATPPYTPPAPQPKPEAKPRTPSPTAQANQEAIAAQKQAAGMDFQSIAEKDANGDIKPLPEPVEWYALKHNPIVKPIRLAMCEPVLRERRAKIESLAIDNVDIIERLDSGLIQQLDMTDKTRISEIVQLIKPFQQMGTLTNELKKKKAIEDVQAAMNQRIVNDYIKRKAEAERVKEGLPADMPKDAGKNGQNDPKNVSAIDILTRLMLETAMGEPLFFYHQILLEAAAHGTEVGLDAKTMQRLGEAKTDEDKIEVMKNALTSLTIEQKRDLLRKTVALRPPPPPLPDIEKMKEEAMANGTASEMLVWRGPKELVDARIALHSKVKATKIAAQALADAIIAKAKPDAGADAEKAVNEAKVAAQTAKAEEEEARKVVMGLVEKHPDYKSFLADQVSKNDGVYFAPPTAAKAADAKPADATAAPADKKPEEKKPEEKK